LRSECEVRRIERIHRWESGLLSSATSPPQRTSGRRLRIGTHERRWLPDSRTDACPVVTPGRIRLFHNVHVLSEWCVTVGGKRFLPDARAAHIDDVAMPARAAPENAAGPSGKYRTGPLQRGRQPTGPSRAAYARRVASSAPWRRASSRLPSSAMPLPAISKAVPWSTDVRTTCRPTVTLTPASRPSTFTGPCPWS
jgi:hypothetical protein